jgi:hypothetical protein
MKQVRDGIYLTDNGTTYCRDHLGTQALYTGRDISGQPIQRVTPEIAAEMNADLSLYGLKVKCEICGREPSLLHAVGA